MDSLGRRRGRGSRRIDDVPDPPRELAWIARSNRIELRRDAVARADLHLAVSNARLEAVEGTHRRTADHLAREVVDAAVAGADEVAGRGDEPHRATKVGAARRDRDEAVRVLVERRRRDSLANVRGRLAGLTDPLDQREDHRPVDLVRETVR